jgi:5-(carboxyamino)imidazole ribonucleotide synthase
MFTQAAQRMGFEVIVLDPDPVSPAGRIASRHLQASYTDERALAELGNSARAVTTEFENVPATSLTFLRDFCPVRPGPEAVKVTQNRIAEKTFAVAQGLGTAPFAAILNERDCAPAFHTVGAPALIKTAQLGYDGKGQAAVENVDETIQAFRRFHGQPCVLERRLSLDLEFSVVLVRGEDGTVVPFPPAENRHVNGILDTTVVPARVSEDLVRRATGAAETLASAMGYVGTMAVEFFAVNGQTLLMNEIAPRPHNSGHYTLDACATDQFEQQVRSLAGLPLGDPSLLSPVAMVNLLGDLWERGQPRWDRALADPHVHLHLYGKSEPRPGRKMGHINVLSSTPEQALERALAARRSLLPSS